MKLQTFPLGGGLDITSPVLALRPGQAIAAINYELAPVAGYRRVNGYERFDGRTSPTDFAYGGARDAQRALIQPVPGSGPVRGVFIFREAVYAFRDTENGINKKLWKATSLGWVEVSTPTLLSGGRNETIIANFTGSTSTESAYGADGVNAPFVLSQAGTYSAITTGAEPSRPKHLAAFRNRLFFGYPGGSLQYSVLGNPTSFNGASGAGEIAVSDSIFNLLTLQGGPLGIYCKNSIKILNGTGPTDFVLNKFSDTGVKENTVQGLFSDAIYLDRQVQRLSTSQNFGDFEANSLSEPIRPLLDTGLSGFSLSVVSRRKNQYYLFDANKDAYVATFNNTQLTGWTKLTLAHQFVCGVDGEDASGNERIFFGGQDGYVYWFNRGSSFDGQAIDSILALAPNHVGGYEQRKRFRKIVIESDSRTLTPLTVFAEFDYGDQPTSVRELFSSKIQGSLYQFSNWNESVWSGGLKGYATAYTPGHGRNITVYIYNRSDDTVDYTLDALTIGFDIRGQVR